ncbi:hypothetical protein EIP91_011065 [Steccherinum ochraceum]|uniref:Uncharacterized protein n=1 Tax=Steccherinum ochraceum TaxID=92696 RepID=A0A4R0S3J0_9APHY|nr:hypothetical protein EIP91_011065 [Steccherinum ochraceum]
MVTHLVATPTNTALKITASPAVTIIPAGPTPGILPQVPEVDTTTVTPVVADTTALAMAPSITRPLRTRTVATAGTLSLCTTPSRITRRITRIHHLTATGVTRILPRCETVESTTTPVLPRGTAPLMLITIAVIKVPFIAVTPMGLRGLVSNSADSLAEETVVAPHPDRGAATSSPTLARAEPLTTKVAPSTSFEVP